MIPGIHYPENETFSYPERKTKCPHCGYEHKADIGFYEACVNCRQPMVSKITNGEFLRKKLNDKYKEY